MRRMSPDAALDAVRMPVEALRPYAPGVAEQLVDNLRLITIAGPGGKETRRQVVGEYIEPVQLQVVCFQLWERLTAEDASENSTTTPQQITLEDLKRMAGGEDLADFVNNALGGFYEQALKRVLEKEKDTDELSLRSWFTEKMITEAETRNLVYQGETHTAGMVNSAVALLTEQYLLRSETRPGGVWFELVHDRFIQPILQSNRRYTGSYVGAITLAAKNWVAKGKGREGRVVGLKLHEYQQEYNKTPALFTGLEREYLEACWKAYLDMLGRLRIVLLVATPLFLVMCWVVIFLISL
jgi:hypothetical protein